MREAAPAESRSIPLVYKRGLGPKDDLNSAAAAFNGVWQGCLREGYSRV